MFIIKKISQINQENMKTRENAIQHYAVKIISENTFAFDIGVHKL